MNEMDDQEFDALFSTVERRIAEIQMLKGIPETIDQYRVKFKDGLVGRWAATFSFGPWPSDAWVFYPDGTGKQTVDGYGGGEWPFEWKGVAERTIQIRFANQDNDNTYEELEEIHYDFTTIDNMGPTIVLCGVVAGNFVRFSQAWDELEFIGDLLN